jgi:hypothetical protein
MKHCAWLRINKKFLDNRVSVGYSDEMYKLEWTDKTFLITGDYLGVVNYFPSFYDSRNKSSTAGNWCAKIIIPMNEDNPTRSNGFHPTARAATDNACDRLGIDKDKAELILASTTCRGVGEFTGEVVECDRDNHLYTATCSPSISMPSLTLVKCVTLDEAKAAVQDAFVVYTETMGAVLEAASAVCKTHSGRTLPDKSIELIIQAASDVGFRLPLEDRP